VDVSSDPGSHRRETREQRVDRNLMELLNELRVALPGVQVLFAFLLVVPFNQRFSATTPFQRGAYFATLLLTASATVFLIAPSVHHRLLFRLQEKEHIVLIANRLSLVGLTMLALAVTGAVLLVTDFVLGDLEAAIATATIAGLFAAIWYAIPLRHGSRLRRPGL
jgi:hypothetical protein